MKKTLLFLTVLLPLFISAQTKTVDGFWGIKFGANKQQVIDAIKAKGGTLDVKSTTEKSLVFDNIRFAQRKAYFLIIKFNNNKFYEAIVTFKPDESDLINEFETMAKELSNSYGEVEVYRNFKSPYEEGDGYETQAIRMGKADYAAFWKTVNAQNDNNYVSLRITKDMLVRLGYQDGTLVKDAIAAQDKKKSEDY